jgi:hypothetical protein
MKEFCVTMLFILLVGMLTWACVLIPIDKFFEDRCKNIAIEMTVPYKYSHSTGCLIKPEGSKVFIPLKNWYYTENK